MRAVFFGTPAIAVPALRALAEVAEVVGVVCQPDRPAGRGLNLQPPAVKVAALELGFEVHQPVKVKTGNLDEWLRERTPDVALVHGLWPHFAARRAERAASRVHEFARLALAPLARRRTHQLGHRSRRSPRPASA